MHFDDIIRFWFKDHGEKEWFTKDPKFDALLRKRFLPTLLSVSAGETAHWRQEPMGRLAEIIVLDQFSRNIFRGKPESFAHDAQALTLAQEALRLNADKIVQPRERRFFYMPYMHSESKKIQKESLAIFRAYGDKEVLKYAIEHKKIIDRFGRYPHRNIILGRKSTALEKAFVKKHPGF